MLTVFIRAVIVYIVVVFVLRLMGTRQIGEMEPYELVITLIIAEVACVPMGDKSVPLSSGIVSVITLFILHQVTALLTKNGKLQKIISGQPIIVIDKNGINYRNLSSLNMRVSDLMQAMRSAGCFSLEEVNYALFETNGQLVVVKNPDCTEGQSEGELPVPVIIDGEWSDEELNDRINRAAIQKKLDRRRINVRDILVLTVDGNDHAVMQLKNRSVETFDFENKVLKLESD